MLRYVAFLRAVNVGGHAVVQMEALRKLFTSFGFSAVETFIASGNVTFQTSQTDVAALESTISSGLKTVLGYDVAAFVRTGVELAEIAAYQPFSQAELDSAGAFNIAFLAGPLDYPARQKLMRLATDIDRFAAHGREVYWLCQKKQSQSTFSNAVLEKKLGLKSTLRGISTIKKLAARMNP
jgi:uncharacterized protein (DUF1697 family)